MDYLGEVGIGSWEYSDYAPKEHVKGWVSAGSGRIDLIGNPLGEALYTRVALEKERGPLMAVCPVNHTGDKHSPSSWKMSNALPTWNWRGCEGKTAKVEVYARADKVVLNLNGKLVGEKRIKKDCIVRFSLPWEPGVLETVSYDDQENIIGSCTLHSNGTETRLCALPEKKVVKPKEICFIHLRYEDENGDVLPLERSILTVSVEGGELLGLGSACPYNSTGFTFNQTDTYYGEALAAVRAGLNGSIKLIVTDGKRSDNTDIEIE